MFIFGMRQLETVNESFFAVNKKQEREFRSKIIVYTIKKLFKVLPIFDLFRRQQKNKFFKS